MVPRRTLQIDLAPRELPFWLLATGGAVLGAQAGVAHVFTLPMLFLVTVRVRFRLI
ncbi:hypothetical protein OG785_16780 [Streptomyces sp. NBC_00006]|uniref:hypothetical protein n=1 Tax=Streptomyces sp. NBC_00006 TaxID=2975619 RepID=UPI00225C200E|nr:hypothetical protein [Streptomyces sp. NBC_00006]MCX5532220.1 hypothetical protein [Streptomyces sp. NBC_00006]